MKISNIVAAAGLLVAAGVANADFSGPYAPGNWSFTNNGGDGAINLHDANTLQMTGNDAGGSNINTDITIIAAAGGNWTFNWSYYADDSLDGFDGGGYLHNGNFFLLSDLINGASGSESVPVNAGDSIGYRIFSVDGGFGPGHLEITKFNAPVPAPASLALLGLGGLVAGRRRR